MPHDNLPRRSVSSVLVVDDTPTNLHLLSRMLRDWGYEPRPVLSGALALRAARAEAPDLILLDITMPEMDGFQVCEQLKADESLKDIPVIFISGLTDTTDKVKGFSVGAVDYVTKPFQPQEVKARVRTHLMIRSLQRELREHNDQLEELVAKRTAALEEANQRLKQAGRLKDEFLGMISHELRTPANGVLGIGDLIITLCPPSDALSLYNDLFVSSSTRLVNLIEDATLVASLENMAPKSEKSISLAEVFKEIGVAHPELRLATHGLAMDLERFRGDRALLKRALTTMVLLASSFSKDRRAVRVTGAAEAEVIRLRIDLDAFLLPAVATADFFKIESPVRSGSAAEPLGLGPVVAHRILAALGGDLQLVKTEGHAGYLEAVLPREPRNLAPG